MDGFTGFKTATAEELPDAVAVMDPFHVVRLAGDALDRCRRRAGGYMLLRLAAIQAGAMGLLGLLLAVVGVYGVTSYGRRSGRTKSGSALRSAPHRETSSRSSSDKACWSSPTGSSSGSQALLQRPACSPTCSGCSAPAIHWCSPR